MGAQPADWWRGMLAHGVLEISLASWPGLEYSLLCSAGTYPIRLVLFLFQPFSSFALLFCLLEGRSATLKTSQKHCLLRKQLKNVSLRSKVTYICASLPK